MRLLVTGAGGLLGMNLALLSDHAHTIVGVDRQSLGTVPFELLRLDLMEPGAFDRALSVSRADAVVHCAAMADIDACERSPAAAWRVNAELPALIAQSCRRLGVRLIHISTDAVFDGTASVPYSEDDLPNPTSVYASSKHAAEGEVLGAYPQALVARVNFYGWSPSGRRSLAEFFVSNLSTGTRVRGFTDVIFCPMLAAQLGEVLLHALDANLKGLYHAVGPEPMSKYAFGLAIAKSFGYDGNLITPDSVESAGLAAKRGHHLELSVHKLSTALGEPLPQFSTGLQVFCKQFSQGYPQRLRSYQQPSPTAGAATGSPDSRAGEAPK